MANQQFVSDLVVAMIEGEPQHQSKNLDTFYKAYDKDFTEASKIESRFTKALSLIKKIFPERSRFTKNLSDFYTLFLFIDELNSSEKIRLEGENLGVIDFTLHEFESEYSLYLEGRESSERNDNSVFERYRETIVGRQREKEVREERRSILDKLISPGIQTTSKDRKRLFSPEQKNYLWHVSKDKKCGICGKEIDRFEDYEPDHITPWISGGPTSIKNGQIAHKACNRSKGANKR